MTLVTLFEDLIGELEADARGRPRGRLSLESLLEMVAGTIRPAIEASGLETVDAATTLMGMSLDLVLADVRTAARLAIPSPAADHLL